MKSALYIPASIATSIFFSTITVFILTAQASHAQWAATYGGASRDVARAIQQTSDGGYIAVGNTETFGAGMSDVWILKLGPNGGIQGQKTYGDDTSDWARSAQQTSDGGYIVAGEKWSSGPANNPYFWVLKLRPNGNVQWQRTYGTGGGEAAWSIRQTSDGGYIVVGYTLSFGAGGTDFWVVKLNSGGNVQWQKAYGGSANDSATSVQQTDDDGDGDADDGYIVAGTTTSSGVGLDDFMVLRLDTSGNILWQNTYGGNSYDQLRAIQQTTDGGFIVVGYTESFGAGYSDFWVIKLYPSGVIQWQKTYGGVGYDDAYSVQQTADGGFVVVGHVQSFTAGTSDFWALKLDSVGNVQWQKTYGEASSYDWARSVRQTSDGGYIVTGETESFGVGWSDFLVLKLRPDGSIDPSCDFINDSLIAGADSGALLIDATAAVNASNAIPQTPDVAVQDTGVSANVLCSAPGEDCTSTTYFEGKSYIKFNHRRTSKDKASLRLCVDQAFCEMLLAGVEEMVLWLDDCYQVTIPGSALKCRMKRKLCRAGSLNYKLIVGCKKGLLKLILKNLDLKDCGVNPVQTCVSIKNGPCLCAEGEFEGQYNRKERLKKLSLIIANGCLP